MKTVAVIKIGSTSTTLLVAADLDHVLERQQRIVNLYSACGPGMLGEVLGEYADLADRCHATFRLAAGGEGLRQHQELPQLIRSHGWPYWGVDGQLEGQLTWSAVKALKAEAKWVWDIGGGSTELCSANAVYSIPVGAAHPGVASWPDVENMGVPVVVGGTAHALYKILGEEKMTSESIDAVQRQLRSHPDLLAAMGETRRKILPAGLNILRELMEIYRCEEVTFSSRGFLEGLWLAASLGKGRAQ